MLNNLSNSNNLSLASGTPQSNHPTLETINSTNAPVFEGKFTANATNHPTLKTINSTNTPVFEGKFTANATNYPLGTGLDFRPNLHRSSNVMRSTACPGGNSLNILTAGPYGCQRACVNNDKCVLWSYNFDNKQCYLKSSLMPCQPNAMYESGRIQIKNQPTPAFRPAFRPAGLPLYDITDPTKLNPINPVTPNSNPNFAPTIRGVPAIPPLPAASAVNPRTSNTMDSVSCPEGNMFNFQLDSPSQCKSACLANDQCQIWSYNNLNNQCYFKNQNVPCINNNMYTSGRVTKKN